ncbi:hypothetical protein AB6A40_005542 [Gnathostoma spinigerum]|uniref:Transmembrane protein 203 n=1 Tax=Gnathostoma spinigerum TaxID=75299 RepID=A0ABD6EFS1_9BILA
MLSLSEIIRWTNITVFELWLHSVGLLCASILLTLKIELNTNITYWQVFAPLFIATGFDVYFLFIAVTRSIVDERGYKNSFLKFAFGWLRLIMTGIFEAVLCYKMNGDLEDGQVAVQSSYGVIFMPIWIFMAALCFQDHQNLMLLRWQWDPPSLSTV